MWKALRSILASKFVPRRTLRMSELPSAPLRPNSNPPRQRRPGRAPTGSDPSGITTGGPASGGGSSPTGGCVAGGASNFGGVGKSTFSPNGCDTAGPK